MATLRAPEAKADLQDYLDSCFAGFDGLKVLDVGCGGASRITFPAHANIVGIDISPESAARNTTIKEIIIGDIQTYSLTANCYDVVLCWELLEHLSQPTRALFSILKALKPNGMLVLAVPNVCSLKGLATKFSPHPLHVWALRTLFNQKNAGRPGYAPFRTYLRWSIEPNTLSRFLEKNGMEVSFHRVYEGNRIGRLRQTSRAAHGLYRGLVRSLNLLSFGRHDFGLSDVILVARRRNAAPPPRM